MTATTFPAQVAAAASAGLLDAITGPQRPAAVLGLFPTAMYLEVSGGEVVALLTSDAVRLPIGLVLPTSSREFPLTRLRGKVRIGSAAIRVGSWSARMSTTLPAAAPSRLFPNHVAVEQAWHRLCAFPPEQASSVPLDALLRDPGSPRGAGELVRILLGVGPGLTPAGDDVLAGLLLGAWSFGLAADPLRAAVLDAAPTRTTALSAALLRCASRGESIPEVNQLLLTLTAGAGQAGRLEDTLAELLRVGHTSGAALGAGIVAAATLAVGRLARGPRSWAVQSGDQALDGRDDSWVVG